MRFPLVILGCIQLSCWPKRSHANPQTIQPVAETMGCFPKSNSRTLLSTTSTQLSKNGKVWAGMFREPSPYIWVSLVKKGNVQAIRRKTQTPTQSQNLWPKVCSPYKICQNNGGTKLGRLANQCLIWHRPTSWDRNQNNIWVIKDQKLDSPEI